MNRENEADKFREVFIMLVDFLSDTENIETNYLRNLIYNLHKWFAAYWKKLGVSKSKLIGKYGDSLSGIQAYLTYLGVLKEDYVKTTIRNASIFNIQAGRSTRRSLVRAAREGKDAGKHFYLRWTIRRK